MACVLAASLVAPRASLAQGSSDKAAAEALFEQAQALMKEGKVAEACGKFELSQRLDAGVGTLLYLADCYEQAGRYASAWATFKEAAAGARSVGQADRETLARSLAEALVPKLSHLTIRVATGAEVPGLEIRRDGQVVPQGLWGVSMPVDAGTRRIEATAPGKQAWSTDWEVPAPGTSEVVVPALTDAPVAAAAAPPAAAAPGAGLSVAPLAPAGPEGPRGGGGGSTQQTIGWVVGGIGVVALGAGGLFALQAKSKDSEAGDQCGADGLCTAKGVELGEQAHSAANLATYLTVGGAVALAGGLTLVLTAPSGNGGTGTGSSNALRIATRVNGSGAFLTMDRQW